MFSDQLFSVFDESDVEKRLALIREQVDPYFEEIGQQVMPILNQDGHEYRAFIAKHARRHINPPMNTWVAFAERKRGYKMIPHYEVGVWDDRLFVWLAFETNIKERKEIIGKLKQTQSSFLQLGQVFVLSNNHMTKNQMQLTSTNYKNLLSSYENKKQSEFLIGRWISKEELRLMNKQEITDFINKTIQSLTEIWDK
ncbi:DUF1054 family protein [Pediococcus inopinatus]|uniref:DUF1054 domain-containing protein n=1 Tax=Pediococcus inopinatus TaxID=114090 RepID=A0ABZ0Q2K1_9LACO|nr:DUF1054 family protein [Pediococcus inopinatus]AVL00279.1 hypothetical protein PI20285_06345 [Pediococcus inopinatus]KRN63401.1 hypothetical protein IV83_GL001109 [Pediococcus inopinatus]WPC17940.1 DUF1054 domain-containing protein [Pediococcus inopinatus]WPC19397.1 DUF1054 domain-containing protein [Pediococcus inopinatus]WPC21190.1 DUF1054 domain-containing protein [Pediococcus inopinatus]